MRRGRASELDIEDIIQALEELKVSHRRSGELIHRLDQQISALHPRSHANPIYRRVTLEECKSLINRRFRIVNPGQGESNEGRLTGVGKIYATITLPNGQKKQRIAKIYALLTMASNNNQRGKPNILGTKARLKETVTKGRINAREINVETRSREQHRT